MSSSALKAAVTGQVAPKPKTLFEHMDNPRFAKGLTAVAGKYMTADRMLRLCINAVKKAPKLADCDPQTVLGAMMASAALGLEPNTVQQQAFLIPYKTRVKRGDQWYDAYDCQFQVGARGFITLAYRNPQIKLITAGAIHDGDKWEQEEGSQAFLRYAKNLRNRGPLLGAFSYVRFDGGAEASCVLPLDEILKIRSKSETYRTLVRKIDEAKGAGDKQKAEAKLAETPWVMWEDDMAAKSATKKHAKQLPLTAADSLAVAADLDDRGEAGTLDLGALTDPDLVRAVVADEAEAPALEHQPAETFTFPPDDREREVVTAAASGNAAAPSPASAGTAKQTDAPTPAASKPVKQPKAPTYAQFVERVLKASDADAAALEVDAARGVLNEQQFAELSTVYLNKWRA
jgi:phage RecT family recombinase